MKDYIIDLGLEFGLRSRLAVVETIQPGPKIKRKKLGWAVWSLRTTPFLPHQPRPPRCSLFSLALFCSSSFSSPPSVLLHQHNSRAPIGSQFSPITATKPHPFDHPPTGTNWCEFGAKSARTNHVQAPNRSSNACLGKTLQFHS